MNKTVDHFALIPMYTILFKYWHIICKKKDKLPNEVHSRNEIYADASPQAGDLSEDSPKRLKEAENPEGEKKEAATLEGEKTLPVKVEKNSTLSEPGSGWGPPQEEEEEEKEEEAANEDAEVPGVSDHVATNVSRGAPTLFLLLSGCYWGNWPWPANWEPLSHANLLSSSTHYSHSKPSPWRLTWMRQVSWPSPLSPHTPIIRVRAMSSAPWEEMKLLCSFHWSDFPGFCWGLGQPFPPPDILFPLS
nr:uncharacterized protein LOC129475408 [Symphalangus syndactylus]